MIREITNKIYNLIYNIDYPDPIIVPKWFDTSYLIFLMLVVSFISIYGIYLAKK